MYSSTSHRANSQSPQHLWFDHSFLLFLPGLFPSSGVAGMVLNIILPLCPVQYFLLIPTLSISLLHEFFHLVFYLRLRLFPGTGASNILLSSSLLTCPYHFSLFSVIFFVTGATFTDRILSHVRFIFHLSSWLHIHGFDHRALFHEIFNPSGD